jgi:DNA-directed RNA polymerase specialized sigma24 family protein
VRPRKQTRDFEGFVSESGDALLRMATLLTSDVHRAEDVYQETLHRLAARWAQVESPMAFCRRVMRNIVIGQPQAMRQAFRAGPVPRRG